jgi:plasmid stability protein
VDDADWCAGPLGDVRAITFRRVSEYGLSDVIEISAGVGYVREMQSQQAPRASLTIRNLEPSVKELLRVRAAEHGHSMEAEARSILQSTLKAPEQPPERNLYERIRARFAPLGGVELEPQPRVEAREPPVFE